MSASGLKTTSPTASRPVRPPEEDPHVVPEELREADAAFEDARRLMFGIAYRMLGSVREAEDVLRDAWTRRRSTGPAEVPDAHLVMMVTRLAIGELHSARARRRSYVGPWLPDPVPTADDPAVGAGNGEALDVATLTLMDGLTPDERAAYVLREAFGFPDAQIAEIIGLSRTEARRVVARAREFMAEPTRDAGTATAARP
ncbi:sigma factor-like helix-turn-helix DNA-binding protein [Streptomyces sp. NPDC008238]